jgi:DNA-binding NarL/FixJ family response regulator
MSGARILIASTRPRLGASLHRALEGNGFSVCGMSRNVAAAVAHATKESPDVVLLDARLLDEAASAIGEITLAAHDTAVVVLTERHDEEQLFAALRAGACGYLSATIDDAGLVSAVQAVLRGEAAIPRTMVTHVVEELRVRHQRRLVRDGSTSVRLTDREWEVFELLNQRLTTREIAKVLYVSQVTVRTHIAAIVKKLGVSDREAAVRAFSAD